jgi:hypothetical protein
MKEPKQEKESKRGWGEGRAKERVALFTASPASLIFVTLVSRGSHRGTQYFPFSGGRLPTFSLGPGRWLSSPPSSTSSTLRGTDTTQGRNNVPIVNKLSHTTLCSPQHPEAAPILLELPTSSLPTQSQPCQTMVGGVEQCLVVPSPWVSTPPFRKWPLTHLCFGKVGLALHSWVLGTGRRDR